MILWRISNHASLTGDGGLRVSARWHTRGRRTIYCSESPASALLEILVHFEIDVRDLPAKYRLLKLHAPDNLHLDVVTVADLPEGWLEQTDVTRATGDRWLQAGRSLLLRVPPAVVPETFNMLLNPAHPDAVKVTVVQVSNHVIDSRLLK